MSEERQEVPPQWANALFRRIEQMHQQIEGMNDRIDTSDEAMDQTSEASSNAIKEDASEPKNITGIPTKHLGPLAEYSGDREGLESWISQANAKLYVDYSNCSNVTKFFMLHNKLRGEAASQLQPWVQAVTGTDAVTPQDWIQQLQLSFGDPHLKEKAQRKLHKLRQSQHSFMECFTEFRKLVLEAGGTCWPSAIKKSYLGAGLNQELQRSMIGLGSEEQSFEEYCSELKRVSDQLEAFNLRNRSLRVSRPLPTTTANYDSSSPVNRKAPLAAGNNMEWEPTGSARIAQGRRAKWVSQEEMQKRKEQGDCYRCGASSHQVLHCPFQKAKRLRTVARMQTEKEPHLELQTERNTDTPLLDSDSEN